MALRDRHLKVAFRGRTVLDKLDVRPEVNVVIALFNFVAEAIRSYDTVDWMESKGNRSDIDFLMFPLFITDESPDLSLNYPFRIEDITFVSRKPEYSPETMSLFQTLSLNVWLSLLVSVVLFALVTFVAMKHRSRWVDVILHVIAIGLNQQGNLVPRGVGEVLLLTTWSVAMTIFTLCFKSVLLSFLTFPPLGGVRTVPELAAAVRAGTHGAFTSVNDLPSELMRSPNGDIRSIGESMSKSPRGFSVLRIHENPTEAYVNLRSFFSYAEEEFHVSKDSMGPLYLATGVGKRFCCKDEMDMLMHRFLASGIDQKIQRLVDHRLKWVYRWFIESGLYRPINDWPSSDGGDTRKITLTDLSGAFLFLAVGHCLSAIVLIVECVMSKRRCRRLKRRN